MPSVVQSESALNRSTETAWDYYANHRAVTTSLVASSRSLLGVARKPTLCLLGSGNLNDVDLAQLCHEFAELSLIDIDVTAVRNGLSRQQNRHPALIDRLSTFKLLSADLSGLDRLIASQDTLTTSDISVAMLINAFGDFSLSTFLTSEGLPSRFHVVASCSLISQLIRQARSLFSDVGVSNTAAILMRDFHLRTLVDLVEPGGCGVLITDFAGTSTGAPELLHCETPIQLAEMTEAILREKRYFLGLSPTDMYASLVGPLFSDACDSVELTTPWCWDLGPEKRYLCYGLTFRKKLSSPTQSDSPPSLSDRLTEFMKRTGIPITTSSDFHDASDPRFRTE
ncbi:MAG: hypothetical protein R3E01_10425 [Pirellulaceae bacterium]